MRSASGGGELNAAATGQNVLANDHIVIIKYYRVIEVTQIPLAGGSAWFGMQ